MLTLQSEDESARCKEQWDVSLLVYDSRGL